jgi:hypothetical protein
MRVIKNLHHRKQHLKHNMKKYRIADLFLFGGSGGGFGVITPIE